MAQGRDSSGRFTGGGAGGGIGGAIRRLVQLVLDRNAAKRTEDDAKKTLKGIDGGFSTLSRTVANFGKGVLAALGLRAVSRMVMSWIQAAAEAERVWRNLSGTIEAAGENFNELEGDVRGLAEAFQDVTIHDGEDFAGALTRMISLTGDVSASINNMGLVANVASQFFGGDLAGAVELVSKVMNGNLTLLQRMGIRVKTAQEGLEVLARRSFGAAERAAGTFSGRVARLSNFMGDFREELGDVVTGSGETAGAIEIVTDALRDMIQWVKDNKDELRAWVAEGINAAISGLRTLFGLARDFLRLQGKLSFTAGNANFQPGKNADAINAQLRRLTEQRKQAEREQAQALAALEKAQRGILGTGIVLLGQANPGILKLNTDLQVASDLLDQIDENARVAKQALEDLGKPKPKGKGDLFNAPQVGKNSGAGDKDDKIKSAIEESTAAQDAIREFGEELNQIGILSRVLGSDFDATEAEASALRQVIEALALAGVDASDNFMVRFRDRLKEITTEEDAAAQVSADLVDTLIGIQTQSDVLGDAFDANAAKASAYQAAIEALTKLGFDGSDPAMRAFAARLREVNKAQEMQRFQMEESIGVAQIFGETMAAALGAGIGPFAAAKAKQNLVEAAELGVRAIVAAINPFTAWQAPILASAAAKHVAIAGAWGALASAMGGGGSSASAASGSLSSGRAASTDSSTRTEPAAPEVHIYIDPLDPRDPRAQRFVHSASQEAQQRYGKNARVHIHSRAANG